MSLRVPHKDRAWDLTSAMDATGLSKAPRVLVSTGVPKAGPCVCK